jgi:formylglycine-generating enzyme required for sulfatase activity
MDQGASMSDYDESDKRGEANKPDDQQLGLTRFSPVGKLAQRVGRRIEIVTRLTREDPATHWLSIKPVNLPAGTLRSFGGTECLWCPPGQFMMGSPTSEPDRDADDEVQHEVVLTRGFFIAETECTQGQWEKVMGENPSEFKGPERPVEQVSWEDAMEYCRKLTAKQRAEGILPSGWEWRLPTEAEWEYAARAGTTGPRYGELDAIGWWSGNSEGQTHPVKQKKPNAWGLYDVIGNVWEWCSDCPGGYPTGSVTDPTGPSSGHVRIFRGGCWAEDAADARAAARSGFLSGIRLNYLGFRPVLSSVG